MKYAACVRLPIRLRLDGGQFIQFAGTVGTITGDKHVSVEDGPNGYLVTFVLDASDDAAALGEARAAVGAALKQIELHDMELAEASVELLPPRPDLETEPD